MPIVTISRQFGSLGDEIARDVAARLGLRLVDQDIINEIAQRLGVPAATVNERDEREGTLVSELVRTMRRLYPATLAPQEASESQELDETAYLEIIRQLIGEVARENDAVIVGRGAPFLLGAARETIHVLITAPLDMRVERVMSQEGLDRDQAVQRINQVDSNRARYIRRFHREHWLDVSHYDLVLNTGHFSQLQAASLICDAVVPGDRAP